MRLVRANVLIGLLAIRVALPVEAAPPAGATAWPDSAALPARFTRIGPEQGLFADVRSITQDHQGFMWFGTSQAGLNRYDGREIKIYRNDPRDSGSLSQNYIWSLFVSRKGVLWVGTAGGLDRYDRERDAFVHFRHDPQDPSTLPNNIVLSLCEDAAGELWVGTRGGLSRLDQASGHFHNYSRATGGIVSPTVDEIRYIAEDTATGLLWLGTSDGFCAFDRHTGYFATFCREPFATAAPGVNAFNALLKDAGGTFWLASENGLAAFVPDLTAVDRPDAPPRLASLRIFQHDPADPATLSGNHIHSAILDRRGRLWAGTQDGLDEFDTRTGTVVRNG